MKRGIFVPIVILCAALLGGCDGSGTSHTPIPVTRQSIESRSVRTFQDGSSVGSSSSSQQSAESSSSVVSASVSHTEEPPVEVQSTTSSSAPASVTSSQSAVSSRSESTAPFSSSIKSAENTQSTNGTTSTKAPNTVQSTVSGTSVSSAEISAPVTSSEESVSSAGTAPEVSSEFTSGSIFKDPYNFDGVVYISISDINKKTGKFHSNPYCGNVKNVMGITANDALKDGYSPCDKCW